MSATRNLLVIVSGILGSSVVALAPIAVTAQPAPSEFQLSQSTFSDTVVEGDTVRVDPASSGDSPIHLNVDLNLNAGPSPLAVSFSVMDTENHLGTSDTTGDSWHTDNSPGGINEEIFTRVLYQWDFGDSASGTWDTTGNSRNNMTGPLGAHVYEPEKTHPGDPYPETCGGKACRTYHPTLLATDENDPPNRASWSAETITVYDPNDAVEGWGAANKTACVSNTTDFTGCPRTCDTTHPVPQGSAYCYHSTADDFDADMTTLIAAGYRRILFKGGDTWAGNGQYSLSVTGPGLIGSYGSGNANVDVSLSGDNAVLAVSGDDWRLQDIDFIRSSGTEGQVFVHGSNNTVNWLVQRTTTQAKKLNNIAMLDLGYLPLGTDNTIHRNLFYVDNEWGLLSNSTSRYMFYIVGWGLYFLGNDFAGSTGSHTIRIPTAEGVLISNNRIGPGRAGGTTLHFRDVPNVCDDLCPSRPFCGRHTKYYVVQDNEIVCRGYTCIGIGMQNCMHSSSPTIEPMPQEDFLIERNFFEAISGSHPSSVDSPDSTHGPSYRFVIRNNIADTTGWDWTSGFVGGPGIKIYNNTCYRSDDSTNGPAACVTPSGASECYNNVLYAPNDSNRSTVRWNNTEPWAGTCVVSSNNFDDGVTGNITSNPFTSSSPSNPVDFTPALGSQIHNAGITLPQLFDDALGNPRPSTNMDAGAVERQ